MKKKIRVGKYFRRKGGKTEEVSAHSKKVNVKHNLSNSKQIAIKNGFAQNLTERKVIYDIPFVKDEDYLKYHEMFGIGGCGAIAKVLNEKGNGKIIYGNAPDIIGHYWIETPEGDIIDTLSYESSYNAYESYEKEYELDDVDSCWGEADFDYWRALIPDRNKIKLNQMSLGAYVGEKQKRERVKKEFDLSDWKDKSKVKDISKITFKTGRPQESLSKYVGISEKAEELGVSAKEQSKHKKLTEFN